MDILGPLPVTARGNRYVLVVMDHFTKWPEAFALPNQEAATIARHLVDDVFCRFGAPSRLLSDRGQAFMGELLREVSAIFDVKQVHTSGYHPQTDGMVERFNATLANMLSAYVAADQSDWDVHLPRVLLAYRASTHTSTGDSPFFLNFGRDARLPTDVTLALEPARVIRSPTIREYRRELVKTLTEVFATVHGKVNDGQAKAKDRYDDQHREVAFEPGDRVWLYTPHRRKGLSPKLAQPWVGPYRVLERRGPVNYKLRTPNGGVLKQLVHVQRLKGMTLRKPGLRTDRPALADDDEFDADAEDDPTAFQPREVTGRDELLD